MMWCVTEFMELVSFMCNSLKEIDYIKVILSLTVLVLSIAYLWLQSYPDLPPGPYGYPLIGNLKLLQDKPHIHLTNLKEKYGDVYCVQLGKHKAVVVCSLSGMNSGMVTDLGRFIGRPDIFSSKVLFSGDKNGGICFSEPDLKYKIKKEFVMTSLDNMCCVGSKPLTDVVTSEAERLVFFMLSHAKHCDVSFAIESTMLRVMMYVVNGKLYEPNDENFMEIWKTFQMRHALCSDNWSVFVPLLQRLQRHSDLDVWERIRLQFDYQRDIVNRHKDQFNPKIVGDMIDHMLVMLESNEDMGVLDQDDLDLLFVEMSGSGFKAVSTTLLWLLLYMASFPDIQEKVYQELITVVGKERLPKLSDQPYLPYTCAVVMETHRLATVMPFLYPHKAVERTQFMGFNIPEETIMLFNVWSLHHDPRHWKHPMKFDPSRFLKEDGSLHIPDHFLPFGDGVRCCPGESLADIQLFLFSTHILYQLNLSLSGETDLDGIYQGYLVSPKPFKLDVTARETAGGLGLMEDLSGVWDDDLHGDTIVSLVEEMDSAVAGCEPDMPLSLIR